MAIITGDEAREVTAEEQAERAKLCYEIEERIRENIAVGREAAWELMRNLYEFDEQNGWTALGYETQAEWLAQPEIGMTRTSYFRLVRKFRELVVRRQLPITQLVELEPSKLDIVMPVIEQDKAPINEVLEDVRSMGARDLRDNYIGRRRQSTSPPPTGDDGDVIEGKEAPTTDKEPVRASEVSNGTEPEVSKVSEVSKAPDYAHAAGHVESWLEVGGDRRKAQRNFRKLLRTHPALKALARLLSLFDGEEDAPSREEALQEWRTLRDALSMEVETGEE